MSSEGWAYPAGPAQRRAAPTFHRSKARTPQYLVVPIEIHPLIAFSCGQEEL